MQKRTYVYVYNEAYGQQSTTWCHQITQQSLWCFCWAAASAPYASFSCVVIVSCLVAQILKMSLNNCIHASYYTPKTCACLLDKQPFSNWNMLCMCLFANMQIELLKRWVKCNFDSQNLLHNDPLLDHWYSWEPTWIHNFLVIVL